MPAHRFWVKEGVGALSLAGGSTPVTRLRNQVSPWQSIDRTICTEQTAIAGNTEQ